MIRVPNPVASTALTDAHHIVACEADNVITAGELATQVAHLAAAWVRQGVQPGDRVALVASTCIDWVVCYHAVGWLGAVVVVVPENASQQEADSLSAQTHATWWVDKWDTRRIWCHGFANMRPLEMTPAATPLPERPWPLDEVRVVLLTSGSTGAPKSIPLTTAQLLFNATGSMIRLGHHLNDRWLCCLALHHIGGLSIVNRCAQYGTTVILERRFDAHRVNHLIDTARITQISLVPAMLSSLINARGEQPFPKTLRFILLGGERAPEALLRRCRHINAPVARTWGMTETASQVCTAQVGDLSHGVGAPLPFARVAAVEGRLQVTGPVVAQEPFVTQDAGTIENHHRVHITGRVDDIIVSGGKKIAPSEVEAVLMKHPKVHDVAVVATPDSRWGQRPIAFVVQNGQVSSQELLHHCRANLSGFKIPRDVSFLDELPRQRTGKVNRRALTQCCVEAHAGQSIDKLGGDVNRSEGGCVDEGMDHFRTGADHGSVGTRPCDVVCEGHRGLAHGENVNGDFQTLRHPNGPHKIAFGMDQGHDPRALIKERVIEPDGCDQQFLVGGMTVFEETTKKNDTGAVDVVKTGGNDVLKGHHDSTGNKGIFNAGS